MVKQCFYNKNKSFEGMNHILILETWLKFIVNIFMFQFIFDYINFVSTKSLILNILYARFTQILIKVEILCIYTKSGYNEGITWILKF